MWPDSKALVLCISYQNGLLWVNVLWSWTSANEDNPVPSWFCEKKSGCIFFRWACSDISVCIRPLDQNLLSWVLSWEWVVSSFVCSRLFLADSDVSTNLKMCLLKQALCTSLSSDLTAESEYFLQAWHSCFSRWQRLEELCRILSTLDLAPSLHL